MATVNIIIKGIALVYHKDDGLWKIMFPFGECHETKFKEGFTDSGIPLAAANRQIRIRAENPSSSFEIDDNYYDFLDLTADYSHVEGVRLKDDWEENAVFMSIENAKLSVHEYTATEHMLLSGNNVTFAPTNIGYSAEAAINCERVVVEVDNHPLFPRVFEQSCTLIFDNDCEQGAEREISDFDMVYNVVEDAQTAAERFVVTKVTEDRDFPIVVGTVLDEKFDQKYKDPFAKGLPCHIVRVSKSENLL
jgi:hypothetical protein